MSYEFIVTYGEGWNCITVKFPEAPPMMPQAEPFPEGKIIKLVSLGQAILMYKPDADPGWGIKGWDCKIRNHAIPAPSPGKEVKVIFSGDGVPLDVLVPGGTTIAADQAISLESADVQGLEEIKPLGELVVEILPDGKFLRFVHVQGLIVKSPPSEE